MSTLRVSNIEAKADASSPTVNEKLKVTNSNGDVLIHVNGETSGITTIGINTTGESVRFDSNQNVTFSGTITAPSGFTGDVGMGLTNPSAKLHTIGDVMIQGTGGVGEQSLFIGKSATVIPSTRGVAVVASQNATADHDMVLKTSTGSSGLVERVRIKDDGNVGIGTDDPGAKLHVAAGNIKVDSGFGIDFSATADTSASGATKSSELFADYEEGTFTFTLTDAGSGNELTYYVAGSNSETTTRYIRIGQMCYLEIHVPFFQNQGSVGTVNVSGSAPFASLHPAILRGGGPFRGFEDATKDKGPIVVIAGDTRGDGGTNFYLHTADEFANSSGYDVAGGWVRDSPGRNAPGLFVSGSYIIADGA